jgi:flagellar basal body-associated protein FliL
MAPRNEPSEVEVEESAAPAPHRGQLAILAVALFLAGAGAGYAVSLFLTADDTEEVVEEATVDEDGVPLEDEAAVKDGTILSLGEMHINLRGGGGGRLLRIEIQVEGSADAVAKCEARQSQLRDAILTVASDYSWAELEGSSGKMRLHDEFLVRINGILRPERVERVYFTQFVVQ